MKESLPLISIIVPVFNSAQYLEKCFDSIARQTYGNIEIILVDDGSTDNSGQLCDEYAQKDKRVIVIHQENQGLAQARNSGIEASRGEYMMFIDSDDWVDLTICDTLLNAIFEHGVQSSMCSYIREYPTKSLPKEIYKGSMIFTGEYMQRRLLGPIDDELRNPENLDCFNSMCGKLYPSFALKGKLVTDNRIIGPSEDLLYNVEVFKSIDSMLYVNESLYHYRKVVNGSITTTYKADLNEKWSNLYKILKLIIDEQQLDNSYYQALKNRIALNTLGAGLNCISDNAGFFEKCKRLSAMVNTTSRKEALKNLALQEMPLHWKVFFFCARHNRVCTLCMLLSCINFMRNKI